MNRMKHIKKFINESDEEVIDWLVDMGLAGGGSFNEALEIPVLNRILDRLGRDRVGVTYWSSGAEPNDWAQLAMPEEEWIKDELLIIGSDLGDIVVAHWKTKVRIEKSWGGGVYRINYQIESKKLPLLGL
jgi:hypothetical protein